MPILDRYFEKMFKIKFGSWEFFVCKLNMSDKKYLLPYLTGKLTFFSFKNFWKKYFKEFFEKTY